MRKENVKISFAILLGIIQGILSLGCAWLLAVVVDIVTGANVNLKFLDFFLIACGYYVVYLIIYWLGKMIYLKAMRDIRIRTKERLSKGLIWQEEALYRKSQIGEVLSRFQYQIDTLESIYYEPLFQLIRNISASIMAFGAILYIQWNVALIGVILFVVFLGLTHSLQKKMNDLQEKLVGASETENNTLANMVNGFYTAKDYAQELFFHTSYIQAVEEDAMINFRYEFVYEVFSFISIHLETFMVLLVILVGGVVLASGNTMLTVGSILGMTQLITSAFSPIGEFGATLGQIRSAGVIRQNFREYENIGNNGKKIWTREVTTLPQLEKLSLQDVSCSYGDEIVLEHVSVEFLAGKKYAIIGESGSGKTTLLRLILKQLTPVDGRIQWNGISYDKIGKASFLPHIGYVAQSPMIFHKNLKENIIAGNEYDPENMKAVLSQSNLKKMRDGIDEQTLLQLPARELSGGEKKRLAYARALYRNSEILILDEFTSSVEEQMAMELEEGILKNDNRLIIHVTHTLNEKNMQLYDTVFEVRDKRVVHLFTTNFENSPKSS